MSTRVATQRVAADLDQPRSLRSNAVLAGVGDLAAKVAALLIVLLMARLLAVEEVAVVVTALAAASVLTSALDLGSATLLTRDGAAAHAHRGRLLQSLLRERLPLVAALAAGGALWYTQRGGATVLVAVLVLAAAGAASLTLFGAYRAAQNVRVEAIVRCSTGVLALVAAGLTAWMTGRAEFVLVSLAVVALVGLVPAALRVHTVATFAGEREKRALRRAVPLGLMALATIVYYRSGTVGLALFSTPADTAVFGVASGIVFGLLLVPNAVTTALLPRLAAQWAHGHQTQDAARALRWTVGLATALALTAALIGPLLTPVLLGDAYSAIRVPFVILCAGVPLIAASGVIGTALLSARKTRVLATQVAATLVVNLALVALLARPMGATGVALATVACELVGLALLVRAARLHVPEVLQRLAPTTPVQRELTHTEVPGQTA